MKNNTGRDFACGKLTEGVEIIVIEQVEIKTVQHIVK